MKTVDTLTLPEHLTYQKLCELPKDNAVCGSLVLCDYNGEIGDQKKVLDGILDLLEFPAARRLTDRLSVLGFQKLNLSSDAEQIWTAYEPRLWRHIAFEVSLRAIEFIARCCRNREMYSVIYKDDGGGMNQGYMLAVINAARSMSNLRPITR